MALKNVVFSKYAYWAFFLYAASIPFEDTFLIPVIGTIPRLFGLLLLITLAPSIRQLNYKSIPTNAYFYVAIVSASLIWSIVPDYNGTFRVIQWIFSALLISNLIRNNLSSGKTALEFYTVGTSIVSILTILKFNPNFEDEVRGSAFENQAANYLAAYLAVAWAYAFFRLQERKPLFKSTWINLSIIIILTIASFITGTRAGWLSIVSIILLNNVLNYSVKSMIQSITVVGLVTIALNFIPALEQNIVNRIEKAQEDKGAGRQIIWEVAKTIITDNLWFGVGYRNFYYAFDEKTVLKSGISDDDFTRLTQRNEGYVTGSGAHNTYIGTFAELGILGILVYVGWFIRLIKIRKRNAAAQLIKFLILPLMIMGNFDDIENLKLLWMVFGIAEGYYGIANEDNIA